ncbi:MAG: coenzyme F420-0:L-glutamate ligase [Holdemania filiformis]
MLKVNEQKQKRIEVEGRSYDRFAIPTPVIAEGDDLDALLTQLVLPELEADDLVFISEKMVACTQGRAIPLSAIVPGRLARLLSRFVTKTPRGIGLGMPETMQMAIEECGVIRILFAALAGALGRLSGQKGWFYQVAGKKASTIDGPCGYTLPPYNHYVVLGPSDPQAVARHCAERLHHPAAIIDATITALRFWGCGPRPCPDAGWPPHCGIIRWGRAASERRLGFCARLAKGKLKSARSWTR